MRSFLSTTFSALIASSSCRNKGIRKLPDVTSESWICSKISPYFTAFIAFLQVSLCYYAAAPRRSQCPPTASPGFSFARTHCFAESPQHSPCTSKHSFALRQSRSFRGISSRTSSAAVFHDLLDFLGPRRAQLVPTGKQFFLLSGFPSTSYDTPGTPEASLCLIHLSGAPPQTPTSKEAGWWFLPFGFTRTVPRFGTGGSYPATGSAGSGLSLTGRKAVLHCSADGVCLLDCS